MLRNFITCLWLLYFKKNSFKNALAFEKRYKIKGPIIYEKKYWQVLIRSPVIVKEDKDISQLWMKYLSLDRIGLWLMDVSFQIFGKNSFSNYFDERILKEFGY